MIDKLKKLHMWLLRVEQEFVQNQITLVSLLFVQDSTKVVTLMYIKCIVNLIYANAICSDRLTEQKIVLV